MRKILFRLMLAGVVAGSAYGVWRLFRQMPERQVQVPTAVVRKGDVVIRTFARGELRAVRQATLVAPNLFGTVQITRLAPLGAFAKEKDLIVEFDDSEVRSRLEERELELQQIEEQIKKAQAELAIRNNQDQVDLLRARYSVRLAELEVRRAELKSAIDAKKDLLTLEEARRRLKQLESDIKSRLEQAEAEIAVLRERRNRALLEVRRERQRLMQVKLLAPISGLVAIRQSRPMGMYFPGMQLPDYREGDQVFPGTPVADVLDLSEMELVAKVNEIDRANLHEGQEAVIRLDAIPDKVFHGRIKSMSGTASANVWAGDPTKRFDVVFSVDMKELLSGLGAKPEQIRMILETAERNRSKPVAAASPPPAFAMLEGQVPGGGAGPGMPVLFGGPPASMASGAPQPGQGQAEPSQRRGFMMMGGMMGGGQFSPEDAQKMKALLEKELGGRSMRDLSPEERQKIFEKIRSAMGGALAGGGATLSPEDQKKFRALLDKELGGRKLEELQPEERRKIMEKVRQAMGLPAGERRPREGPEAGGGPRGERGGVPGFPDLPAGFGLGSSQQFSEKDLESAKLPPPPEENSQLEVLLRPGLLADVEIIVEKIPNAIYVPVQAVFEKDGRPVVYVRRENTFEPRFIKPLKRSESVMVIAEGVQPGEVVALSDPTARAAEGKQQEKKGAKSGALPVGGAGGGL
ncbi:MAG: efflux RND transporter periplasmic adaptor subunit [Bryobacterales bacterium]|nr:efflux RND transporter periplasmic adaptor subunit [Bryobacteraceae bacterium]MDW8129487.1 efflux RND transporter periplasmic adaptor subunit [Bryobacterales bacterium]